MPNDIAPVGSVIKWTSAIAGGRRGWLTPDMVERYSPYHARVSYDVAEMCDGTFAVIPEMVHPEFDGGTSDRMIIARLSTFGEAEAYVIALARVVLGIDLTRR